MEALGRLHFRRVHYSGLRADPREPFRPAEIQAAGARIGFLAATQFLNLPEPRGLVLKVDYQNEAEAASFIERLRELAPRYDLFVLSYHGGREYAGQPEGARVRFFRRLIEAGVDIVYGHHPHRVQGFELIGTERKRGLILYSAGNFLSGMSWGLDPLEPQDERTWTGDSFLWVVSLTCSTQGCSVEGVQPIPITNVRGPEGGMVVSTFPGLAGRGLSESWGAFYRERSRCVLELLHEWAPFEVDRR